jgi:hypothetical protein
MDIELNGSFQKIKNIKFIKWLNLTIENKESSIFWDFLFDLDKPVLFEATVNEKNKIGRLNFVSENERTNNNDKNTSFDKDKDLSNFENHCFGEKIVGLFGAIQNGPMKSWLCWLQDKLIIYNFVFYKKSVTEISDRFNISMAYVTTVIKNFFLFKFSDLRTEIEDFFKSGHNDFYSKEMIFSQLEQRINQNNLDKLGEGCLNNEICSSMEITSFNDWNRIVKRINYYNKKTNKTKMDRLKFVMELFPRFYINIFNTIFLIIIYSSFGLFVVNLIEYSVDLYERKTLDKIKIYSSESISTDKTLSFVKNERVLKISDEEFFQRELSQFEIQEKLQDEMRPEERFEEETEFINLTDVNNVKENETGTFRDVQHGEGRIYRLLYKTTDFNVFYKQLEVLKEKLKIKNNPKDFNLNQVPGGLYGNWFLPTENFNLFLNLIKEEKNLTLFISKTTKPIPKGKFRVFVWVKKV